jgi:hypothetical protein
MVQDFGLVEHHTLGESALQEAFSGVHVENARDVLSCW